MDSYIFATFSEKASFPDDHDDRSSTTVVILMSEFALFLNIIAPFIYAMYFHTQEI